jgi:hypothetical protein
MWFYEHVRNNSDGHLSSSESMDYKQIKSPGVDYADFGNFNYAVVGKALGFSDFALEFGAGVAQGRADGLTYAGAIARSTADPFDFGDNPGDQDLIMDGISAAKSAGIAKEGLTLQDFLTSSLTDFFEVMGGVSGILDSAYDFWFGSRRWAPRRDPLTLDLDGDGLETEGIDTGRLVYFDHNGDGVKTATGWVGSDDGFLVLDRNGNGTIDSGTELFGDSTVLADGSTAADGFAALSEQDTNGDGVVDANDAGWADLRIWRDLNQNGISEAGELQSLDDIGIASLDVGAQSHSQVLADGNRLADLGRFTWATGEVGEIESTTGQSGDIDLAENSFYRQFTDPVPLTTDAQALPEMRGSGALRDMREAASLSPDFAQCLTDYSQATTRDQQLAQLDGLISSWAQSSGQVTSVELAQEKGYQLIYLAPGMSAGDYENYLGHWNADPGTLIVLSDEDRAHLEALQAEQAQLVGMLGTLEHFNGQSFVNVQEQGVVLGSGQWNGAATNSIGVNRVYVSLSATQLDLLNQSYQAIRTSVYDGLIKQTRLSPYLDAISVTYDDQTGAFGIDASGLDAALDAANTADPRNGLIDLIELTRYSGDALSDANWDADERLRERHRLSSHGRQQTGKFMRI